MILTKIYPKAGRPEIDVCIAGYDYDRFALYIKDCESTLEKFAVYEDLLIEIGDFAHNESTGPSVPDALWKIREMAYQL